MGENLEKKKNKEGSFKPIFIIMALSLVIAGFWDKVPFLKNAIHYVLDPTAGALLNMNLTFGMFVLIFTISLITTLVQKYATDQKTIRELKAQQKDLNKKSKEFAHDLEKRMALQKEMGPLTMKLMKHSMRPLMFTGIPFILLFRWFWDYFNAIPDGVKFFGFMSWFWFYLIFAMIFGGVLRKVLKVV